MEFSPADSRVKTSRFPDISKTELFSETKENLQILTRLPARENKVEFGRSQRFKACMALKLLYVQQHGKLFNCGSPEYSQLQTAVHAKLCKGAEKKSTAANWHISTLLT